MFRLLKRMPPPDRGGPAHIDSASNQEYLLHGEALEAAKGLCKEFGWTIVITQDLDEVQMAPVVSSLGVVTTQPSPKPLEPPEVTDGPARVPQSKPRLLIVPDRRATPAEIFGHLMVVAEGRIVKNAFGALELGDMPLTGPELIEVKSAMGAT